VADPHDPQNRQDPDSPQSEDSTLLIAHLRAQLMTGESFDLLPIKHEQDVKTEVNALIESWAHSGFLLRGHHLYPWHQVRSVEVTEVEELPRRQGYQRLEELYAADRARLEESFWRTKRKSDDNAGSQSHGDQKDKDESKSVH
jgi:hypothetical protein